MADQNKTYEQVLKETLEQTGGNKQTLEIDTNPSSPSLTQTSPSTPTSSSPPPSSPNVVIPSSGNELPKWFYFVFVITLIIFIVITILLVKTVRQQKAGILPKSIPLPTSTSAVKEAVSTIIPIKETTDAGILKLSNLKTSDKLTDLRTDVENTDLALIDQTITTLDEQMSFKPEESR